MFGLLAPVAVATCVGGVFSGALTAGWRLERVAASNVLRGLGGLAGIGLGAMVGKLWPVPLGLAVGELLRMAWLRRGVETLVAQATQGSPAPVGTSFRQAAANQSSVQIVQSGSPVIERLLISGAAGAISHVEYAVRVLTMAAVAFDGGLGPWLLARWTNQHSDGTLETGWRQVYRLLAVGALVAAASGALLALVAPLATRILFLRGAFGPADAEQVSSLLRWYVPGFIFNMAAICVERLLLARGQNGVFLRLSVLRTATRLVTVALTVRGLQAFALPVGFVVGEAVYLCAGLVVTRPAVATTRVLPT
jgi:peptidoglycan biosynthesis protein MviN/MurJ (putative lipid II flippase)